MLDWICKANRTAAEPQDCDWPNCGCDPHAERVINRMIEIGWESPDRIKRMEEDLRHDIVSALERRFGDSKSHGSLSMLAEDISRMIREKQI